MAPVNCNTEAEELERLVTSIRKLRIVKSNDLAWDRPPALRVIDCVLSLNRRYRAFVVPRLDRFAEKHKKVLSVRDLKELIENYGAPPYVFMGKELDYNDKARALILSKVVNWFARVPSLDELRAWAEKAKPSDYLELQIHGFGLAGFQYMRMLFEADTTKPDKWIIKFISDSVGRKVSDIQAVYLFERAAKEVGVRVRDVDTTVWELLGDE